MSLKIFTSGRKVIIDVENIVTSPAFGLLLKRFRRLHSHFTSGSFWTNLCLMLFLQIILIITTFIKNIFFTLTFLQKQAYLRYKKLEPLNAGVINEGSFK